MKQNSKFIPIASPRFAGNEKKYLLRALDSSWISSKGEFIDKFESKFANYVGCRYSVSTSNGTSALHLALLALGLGPGDEVLVPDLTFIASVNSITYTGAKPVLVDVDRTSWNVDLEDLKRKITSKTKAIMAVHLYGLPTDMGKITAIAKSHGLDIVEDSAESLGSEIKIGKVWKKTGSVGKIGCFSFFGNKLMTTGEGGMVVTDDPGLAAKMKMLRDHGQDPKRRYFHPLVGFNYRMTNLQAAIGLAQLEKINDLIGFKKRLQKQYLSLLKGVRGLEFQKADYEVEHVCWLFSIVLNDSVKITRQELMERLDNEGIETRPFFTAIHDQPYYKVQGLTNNASFLSERGLNLPSGYDLDNAKVKKICKVLGVALK